MTNRKSSDNLTVLKQYRGLIEEVESALQELLDPEKVPEEEIDFPYDVFIDDGGCRLVVEVETPGLTMEQLKIYGFDQFIEISGNKDTLRSNRYENCVCLERENGTFRKVIHLGKAVNFNNAAISLENGLLTIKFPIIIEKRGIIKIEPETRGDNE
jgi:HSP20 family molecular chaperone IbpA